MLPISDPFYSLLKRILDANYNPEITFDEPRLAGVSTSPQSPYTFYDRHLMPSLVLKKVIYTPSITHALSKACDTAIQDFVDDGHKFTSNGYTFGPETGFRSLRDAHAVSAYYADHISRLCHRFAFRFCLQPECDTWQPAFWFMQRTTGNQFDFMTESWLEMKVDSAIECLHLDEDLKNSLSDATKDKMLDLWKKFPRLATWHMFAMTDPALAMLQTVKQNITFEWEFPHTTGLKTASYRHPPPDAPRSFSYISSRSSKRSNVRQAHRDEKRVTRTSKVIRPPKAAVKKSNYRPDFRHFLQRAWTKASTYDSTFIILNCGRYERIGIRHRASQTLYLSGVIDTINTRDPRYRKLHLGLHIAILKDAIERQELSDSLLKKSGQKRSAEDLEEKEISDSKRRKSNPPELTDSKLSEELAKRKLAVVNLDYGAFCSTSPSSFFRVGPSCCPGLANPAPSHGRKDKTKSSYNQAEYFLLTLKAPRGEGAVGIVHPATLEMTLENGDVLTENLILKLAFSSKQAEGLQREFEMYRYLSEHGVVEGILTVHGLFQDPESSAMGMLMSDGGQSLRRREKERSGDTEQVTTSDEEREAFLRILNSLHDAYVWHHDIRAENLLINSDNKVFIIDFDRAELNPRDDDIEQELVCMNDLLDGEYEYDMYY
ncbi:hypothetical protein GALMADRAFT_253434 [Galerina marginata CBS 339.88]|uniref:Protein kinase domain-containing protein n=1 Tax=Galerina marginata (strain CBS 339.88) TaxID=685588 RepID=A0A067SY64_GALM3|nr:hypothetical protein GALMADRAFT_253434 [Galerina marginata CBS 339.88]